MLKGIHTLIKILTINIYQHNKRNYKNQYLMLFI